MTGEPNGHRSDAHRCVYHFLLYFLLGTQAFLRHLQSPFNFKQPFLLCFLGHFFAALFLIFFLPFFFLDFSAGGGKGTATPSLHCVEQSGVGRTRKRDGCRS